MTRTRAVMVAVAAAIGLLCLTDAVAARATRRQPPPAAVRITACRLDRSHHVVVSGVLRQPEVTISVADRAGDEEDVPVTRMPASPFFAAVTTATFPGPIVRCTVADPNPPGDL